MKDVAVIGGGLAGLVSAILLQRQGHQTVLFERKKYPFHRVCGEYISNEVATFLISNDLDFRHLKPANINLLHFSAPKGNDIFCKLNPGGFGLSRYAIDHFLSQKALEAGVELCEETEIQNAEFADGHFKLSDKNRKSYETLCCIGAFGKRSNLDVQLNRDFMLEKSGFVGVKMHYRADYPEYQIGLHNFEGGYCGISNVENGIVNVCYMTTAESFKAFGGFEKYQEKVLDGNPHLHNFFNQTEPLFDRPLVISQMYFGVKEIVKDHLLFCGDSAGSITPLTGNGMANAIRSGQMVAFQVSRFLEGKTDRKGMEEDYRQHWKKEFGQRIRIGNLFQPLFGKPRLSGMSLKILKLYPGLLPGLISLTHGKEME